MTRGFIFNFFFKTIVPENLIRVPKKIWIASEPATVLSFWQNLKIY